MLPKKLQTKLETRIKADSLRTLFPSPLGMHPTTAGRGMHGEGDIDFSSNDYLGFSKNETIFSRAGEILKDYKLEQNGATGSRLLSGNHALYQTSETLLAETHQVESALIFNSGYDANVGFFSSVPQRGDLILYDELIHASIRDGIQMSHARAYKFRHNDLGDLKKKIKSWSKPDQHDVTIYVVTESVFSMDGDSPQLKEMADICEKFGAKLVVDEAHALGVFGIGLIDTLRLRHAIFARLVTFGKAMGCHGAAILGSAQLKSFLVNFARSLIYTTALPPHAVATIIAAYEQLLHTKNTAMDQLNENIRFFDQKAAFLDLKSSFIPSKSAIKSIIIPGNNRVKTLSRKLKESGFDVKPILSPTVPKGQERLRFCLHSFNLEKEIHEVLNLLKELLDAVPHDGKDH